MKKILMSCAAILGLVVITGCGQDPSERIVEIINEAKVEGANKQQLATEAIELICEINDINSYEINVDRPENVEDDEGFGLIITNKDIDSMAIEAKLSNEGMEEWLTYLDTIEIVASSIHDILADMYENAGSAVAVHAESTSDEPELHIASLNGELFFSSVSVE